MHRREYDYDKLPLHHQFVFDLVTAMWFLIETILLQDSAVPSRCGCSLCVWLISPASFPIKNLSMGKIKKKVKVA